MKYTYSRSKFANKNPKYSDTDIEQWAEMYVSGNSSKDIAKKYGTSSPHVIHMLRKMNVPIRSISETKLGSKNPKWVGDKVKYFPLHKWVKSRLPKTRLCQMCNKVPPMDLANKGIYDRDLNNWEWLCRRCHMLSDGRLNNLKNYGKKKKSLA